MNPTREIKRIALITDGITPFVIGGMQRHSYNIAKYFAIAGIKVELYHCVPPKTTASEIKAAFDESLWLNITHHIIPFPKHFPLPGHYLRENYEYSATIYRSIKKFTDIDLIVAKGFCAWHLLKMKSKGELLPPVVLKFHGYEMYQKNFGIKEALKQYLLKGPVQWNVSHADYVWSYGGKITTIIEAIGVSKNKIIEFPACIEEKELRLATELSVNSKLKFVYMGRYERRKGIEELCQTIQSHSEWSQQCEFHFIGNIPEKLRLNLDHVIYHGAIQDKTKIFRLLDSMDVMLVPSYAEGMPNVILEGMARGLAIIGTDVGGVSKMIDEKNGILIHSIAHLKLDLEVSIEKILNLEMEQVVAYKKNAIEKIRSSFLYENTFSKLIMQLNKMLS